MTAPYPRPVGKRRTPSSLTGVFVVILLATTCSDAATQSVTGAAEPGTTSTSQPSALSAAATESPVTITYLANEGFLLEAGERAVLIDALFGDGLSGYPVVPKPLRDELERGEGRFSGVDCVLATHAHGDHFDPRAVALFLDHVPAQFISTREAVEEVQLTLSDSGVPEPLWLQPARHQIEPIDCGGLKVSAMSFHHGRLMTRNLAYLIDFDGFTILHVGDTEITADEIRPWALSELAIDVAILPAWHLTEPLWIPVIAELGAYQIVAMHLASADAPRSWFGSAGSLDKCIAEIQRRIPEAWIPVESLARREFGRRE
jgi:L-ascorbate metabolism protein UlaG (beta-lactamase superfamily)